MMLFVVFPNIDQFYYRIAKKKGNSKVGVAGCSKIDQGRLLGYERKTKDTDSIFVSGINNGGEQNYH